MLFGAASDKPGAKPGDKPGAAAPEVKDSHGSTTA